MLKKSLLADLTLAQAELAFAQGRSLRGAVVEMLETAPGRFSVSLVWDDAGTEYTHADLDAFERAQFDTAAPRGAGPAELGVLSQRFESNGKPGAIGWDSTGGYSYGSYQIAARTGTLKAFIDFLQRRHPALHAALQEAGGPVAGLNGTEAFKSTWRRLALEEGDFARAQHGFIQATHYEPFLQRLKEGLQLDVASRSAALQNVCWSVSVQHGPANRIFINALAGQTAAALDDAAIIRRVYAERSLLMRYFPHSTERVRQALAGRFAEEQKLALAMCAGQRNLA